MSRALHSAASAAGELVISDATLRGFSVREAAVTPAVATVVLRNGVDASAPAVVVVELAANASQTAQIAATDCPDGIFIDRVAGTTEVILHIA